MMKYVRQILDEDSAGRLDFQKVKRSALMVFVAYTYEEFYKWICPF